MKNFENFLSAINSQRIWGYALLAALTMILLVHAPIVPVVVGCGLGAAVATLRTRMRRA